MVADSQSNLRSLARMGLITFIGSVAIELVYFLVLIYLGDGKPIINFDTYSYASFSLIALVFLIYHFYKRIKVELIEVIAFFSICKFLIIAPIWLSLTGEFSPIESRYYGIESGYKGHIYKENDRSLKAEITELEKSGISYQKTGFLFWQTGAAKGFKYYKIIDSYTFFGKIELFFTSSLLSIVEITINGLINNFGILILIQLLWFKVKNKWVL